MQHFKALLIANNITENQEPHAMRQNAPLLVMPWMQGQQSRQETQGIF